MRGLHPRRGLFFAACVSAVMAVPAAAAAQPSTLVDGLSAFTAAVEGTYGDEGNRLTAALTAMARGVAEWDATIEAFEARLSAETSSLSPADRAVRARLTLAQMYVQRGRPHDALRHVEAVTAGHPLSPGTPGRRSSLHADAHLFRGVVLDALGRRADAAQAFRAAWLLDDHDPIAAYLLLRRPAANAGAEDARAARERVTRDHRTVLEDGAPARAFPALATPLSRLAAGGTPVIPLAAYSSGYARLSRGDYDGAIAEFRRAVADDPLLADPAAAELAPAASALRQNRMSDARTLLEAADARHDSSEAHRLLGLAYWAESQDDRSAAQLAVAIQRNPRNERARLALARVLSSAGRHDEAARALEDGLRVLPNAALIHFWLASAYERLNRMTDARREFEAAAAGAVAGAGAIYAAIGRLATLAGDAAGAADAFARASDANLNDAGAHKSLADALLRLDRADEAFVELAAAALVDPRDAGAFAALGRLHLDARRHDEALAALRRAVALAPDDIDARYALATALIRTGNSAQGEQELERVQQAQRRTLADRRSNMSLDVLGEEALLHASEGRYDRAAALYRQLADRYAELGRPLEAARARAMYERSQRARQVGQEPAR